MLVAINRLSTALSSKCWTSRGTADACDAPNATRSSRINATPDAVRFSARKIFQGYLLSQHQLAVLFK